MDSPSRYKINKISNNCNEFIVCHLTKVRGMAYKTRNDRKFAIYNTAIQSVKRYPLPLICSAQLRMLNGIGDCLCDELTKLIKNHYKSFLLSEPAYIQKSSQVQKYSSNIENQEDDLSRGSQLYQINQEQFDNKSVKSAIVPRTYKPRPNTAASDILMAISKISANQSIYLDKKQVSDFIKEQNGQLMKGWTTVLNTILTHGYISQSEAGQIMLTEKGRQYICQLNQKNMQITSKSKVLSEVSYFKSQIQQKKISEECQQQEQTQNRIQKKPFLYNCQSTLTLVIDCRQMKNQSDRNFFQEKLTQKYGIICKTVALSVGDFIWMVDDNVLDFIVERKKADDLASSIVDGRYKQQKYRLKSSRIENIYYLFEGHPTQNCNKSQKELENALLKTRIKERFKIVRTKNINQSLKFLSFMHNELKEKMFRKETLVTFGDLNNFNKENSKKRGLTIQLFFGLGIKCFPGIGKVNVGNLMKYFKTFRTLHDKLKQFGSEDERIEFIKELLKKGRAPTNFAKLIVNLLFNREYK